MNAREDELAIDFGSFKFLFDFKFEFLELLFNFGVDVPGLGQGPARQTNCVEVVWRGVASTDHALLNLFERRLPREYYFFLRRRRSRLKQSRFILLALSSEHLFSFLRTGQRSISKLGLWHHLVLWAKRLAHVYLSDSVSLTDFICQLDGIPHVR